MFLLGMMALLTVAEAEPAAFDFQGVAVGITLDEFKAKLPNARCSAPENMVIKCAGEKPEFAHTFGATEYRFFQKDDQPARLYEIQILGSPLDQATALAGLRGRWGAPTTVTALGAEWHRPKSSIELMSLSNGIIISFKDDQLNAAQHENEERAAAKGF